jgi:multisubunit Na+/H+ antiporter MnhC subunit
MDITFWFSLITLIVIPLCAYGAYLLVERHYPHIIQKHKKVIVIAYAMYAIIFIAGQALYYSFSATQPGGVAPATTEVAPVPDKEFFKKPATPQKGQGPGTPSFR